MTFARARYERILLLGCPGSGKTTLARSVARFASLPLVHLDDEHWGEGWARPSPQTWNSTQRKIVAAECWVVDGNYQASIELRAARAQLVIVLDASTFVCLARVLRRAHRIRRGDPSQLPARVRMSYGPGVRATSQLLNLIRKIASFRARSFWSVVDAAQGGPDTMVVLLAGAGRTRLTVRWLRRQCRLRGLAATVIRAHGDSASLPAELELLLRTEGGRR